MKIKYLSKNNISKVPKASGVYCFSAKGGSASGGKDKKETLYIGKAINLKKRIKDHFRKSGFRDHFFIDRVGTIGYIETGSEIEALILEANLIRRCLPKYNVAWKDGKNYLSVGFSKEKLPRVFLGRRTETNADFLGPFTDARALKTTLKLLRRVFPFYTTKKHGSKPCQYCLLGLCPGPNPDQKQYRKNISNLMRVLRGQKQGLIKKLRHRMVQASNEQDFEKAAQVRDQVFALESVFSHKRLFETMSDKNRSFAELQKILKLKKPITRIEAYDISNIQGQQATGSMIVFKNGRPDKDQYRKFKIRFLAKPNDTAMLKETLERRFHHSEWPYPQVVLIDGGIGQLNTALKFKNQKSKIKITKQKDEAKIKDIFFLAIAKRHNELFIEGLKKPILLKNLPQEASNLILYLRDEAHRFAKNYHLKLRRKAFLDQG
jgi:excinuclease ABC subunit C